MKQTIINRIYHELTSDGMRWDDCVLEGLTDAHLKDSIIKKKNEIKKDYEKRFKFNSSVQLFDYCANLFKPLGNDHPQINTLEPGKFRKFSHQLLEVLLYKYLSQAKSLSELCSKFPNLKYPLNFLEKEPLGSKFFRPYFEKSYKDRLTTLKNEYPAILVTDHSKLISDAEAIMLKDFWFPKPGSSNGSSSEEPGTHKKQVSLSGKKVTDPSGSLNGSPSKDPGAGGSSSPSGMEMGKILGITFTVVAVVLAACGAVFFLRQKRSKAVL